MRSLRIAALLAAGCGGSTALYGADAGSDDDGGEPVDAAPALQPAKACDRTCDGEVDIEMGGGHIERPEGGTLAITVRLENCGNGIAPPDVRLVLRGRDQSSIIEVLDETATTLEIPSLMSEPVTVRAPWEKWSRYIDRRDLCLEIVLEPGDIEDCSLTGLAEYNQMDVDGCCHCVDER